MGGCAGVGSVLLAVTTASETWGNDAVTCTFAIFFLRPERVFPEVRRILKPGGRVGLSLSAGSDPAWRWYNDRLVEYARRHPIFLDLGTGGTRDGLPDQLVRAGFIDVQMVREDFEFVYRDEDEWWASLWTHGERARLERMPPGVPGEFKR